MSNAADNTPPSPVAGLRFVDQTGFGVEDGNCFAAAIASIAGLDVVTLTVELGSGEGGGSYQNGVWVSTDEEHWWDRAVRVMRSHGWELGYTTEQPDGYAIYSGVSPRGLGHSTVGIGGAIVFDPHPSRDGLLAVDQYFTLTPNAKGNADNDR